MPTTDKLLKQIVLYLLILVALGMSMMVGLMFYIIFTAVF